MEICHIIPSKLLFKDFESARDDVQIYEHCYQSIGRTLHISSILLLSYLVPCIYCVKFVGFSTILWITKLNPK